MKNNINEIKNKSKYSRKDFSISCSNVVDRLEKVFNDHNFTPFFREAARRILQYKMHDGIKISNERLMTILGCSKRSVQSITSKMQEVGLINKVQTHTHAINRFYFADWLKTGFNSFILSLAILTPWQTMMFEKTGQFHFDNPPTVTRFFDSNKQVSGSIISPNKSINLDNNYKKALLRARAHERANYLRKKFKISMDEYERREKIGAIYNQVNKFVESQGVSPLESFINNQKRDDLLTELIVLIQQKFKLSIFDVLKLHVFHPKALKWAYETRSSSAPLRDSMGYIIRHAMEWHKANKIKPAWFLWLRLHDDIRSKSAVPQKIVLPKKVIVKSDEDPFEWLKDFGILDRVETMEHAKQKLSECYKGWSCQLESFMNIPEFLRKAALGGAQAKMEQIKHKFLELGDDINNYI